MILYSNNRDIESEKIQKAEVGTIYCHNKRVVSQAECPSKMWNADHCKLLLNLEKITNLWLAKQNALLNREC